MNRPNYFRVEESRALLRAIWPHWPDLRGMRPVPQNLGDWLNKYRDEHPEE
jgi:hypothetical protein